MDLKTSQFGTITAVQANGAGVEGYFPYIDPSQTDPDLRNKRMTKSESKKFFGLDTFTALSGTSWDGSNKTLTLTSNTALTFASTKRSGILRIKQDGTGSRTLSINGVSVPVSSGANTITVVSFFYDDVAGVYLFSYDTNILGNVGGGGGSDTTPPGIVTVSVENAEPNVVLLAYGETLDSGSVPATSAYTVTINGTTRTISGVAITGANVKVTFGGAAVISTDTITLDYVVPGTNPIQDVAGNDAAALTGVTVGNNVGSGGGTFTNTNRLAFYKNSSMVRSGGNVTQWTNADGDTTKDFVTISLTPTPTDATTGGLTTSSATGDNLKQASQWSIAAPLTVYFLVKKTGTGALLSNVGNTNGYVLFLDASALYFNPTAGTSELQTGTVGIANMSVYKVVTLVWNGAGTNAIVYLDGVAVGTFSGSITSSNLVIDYLVGYSGDGWNGNINGLAFFNVAHDATTVGTQYSLFKTAAEA